MISTVQPLYIGNALRVFVEPPAGAIVWRVYRKGSNTFSGMDDASALLVFEGGEKVFTDAMSLPNDIMAFYKPWYSQDGVSWTAGAVGSGTPRSTYTETSTDALSLVRDRLEAGLQVECKRGTFMTELGYIQVYTASPSLERDLRFPLVTVHLDREQSNERGIGGDIVGLSSDPLDGLDWQDGDGWLADVELTIIGWCLNGDERNELRKAIRRIILANMTLFSDQGLENIVLSQSDVNAVEGEYPAPMFMVNTSLTCLAPVVVAGANGDSVAVEISVSPLSY